ncbi:hypothetical protein K2891_004392 [Escherichia coli]|nr:hypothetical protein [Escherichia coli]EHH5054193.1 hypothetical protein [Escherichia coli]EHW5499363.1 hypothetical protein [Escherichia coli]EII8856646.1 hypothetical protein [Escherichia coli]HAM7408862.1 hypothetical protein [Escherichia coli]
MAASQSENSLVLLSSGGKSFCNFVKYFFPLDREDLLNLMDLTKDSPDAKQDLLDHLLSGKRMTRRDKMDIKRILKTKEALNNIRKFLDKKGNK